MKRFTLFLAMIMALAVSGISAKDTYAHDASVLPEAARSVISKNFKAGVSVVKIDKEFGRISEYEVILTDGSEITFDRNGNWDNVETSRTRSVPDGFIPKNIRDDVKKNHAGTKIVGIDKERSGYEIELSNGIDMKFSKTGEFLRYDD